MHIRWIATVAIATCLQTATPLAAQFAYVAPQDTIGYSAETPTVHQTHFQIWQPEGSAIDTQGFSMSVAHDVGWLSVDAIEYGPAFDDWTPDIFVTDAYENGWTCGVVYWFLGGPPSGLDWPDFTEPADAITITYTVDAAAPFLSTGEDAVAQLQWTPIGSPTVENVVVVSGASLAVSEIDGSLTFTSQVEYIRGDMNGDGQLDIADVFTAEDYLFLGGDTPTCLAALDVNADLTVNIADIIRLLGYLFISDAPPAEPFESCGNDPMGVPQLSCVDFGGCP